jgi:hypothetical protein
MFSSHKLSETSFYAAILLIVFFALAPEFFALAPGSINPDTYLYISFANYYIFESPVKVLDAYTVGPVIPLVITAVKFVLMDYIEWDANADILLVKSLAIFCYMSIFLFSAIIMKKTLPSAVALHFILLSLLLLPISMDTVSLNGELVSVVLLLLLVLTFRIKSFVLWVFAVSFVSFLVLNTKVQSIIFLGLLLIWGSYNKRIFEKYRFALVIFTVLSFDLILYLFDLGIVFRFSDMLGYSGLNNTQNSNVVEQFLSVATHYLAGVGWAIDTSFHIAPLIVFIVCYSIFKPKLDDDSPLIESPLLWFFVLLITMITPGKYFQHYGVYAVFYSVFMFPKAAENLTHFVRTPFRYSPVVLSILLMLLIYKSIVGAYSPAIGEEENRIYPSETLSYQVPAFLDIVSKEPGTLLVHGWDYRFYSIFSRGFFGMDLASVVVGSGSESQYFDAVETNSYKYIVDVTAASGWIRGSQHSISPATSYGRYFLPRYKVLARQNGFVLYEKGFIDLPFQLVGRSLKDLPPLKIPKMAETGSVLSNMNWIGSDYYQTEAKGYQVFGSYIDSDADVGFIELDMTKGDSFYYRSGPTSGSQSLTLVLDSGEERQYVLPVLTDWTLLVFDSKNISQKFTIIIRDSGAAHGEWSAIALSDYEFK